MNAIQRTSEDSRDVLRLVESETPNSRGIQIRGAKKSENKNFLVRSLLSSIVSVLLLSTAVPAFTKELKPMNTNSSVLSAEQKAAEAVVRKYMDYLHSANMEGIMSLYDDDAVFLPADAPTLVGKAKIRESYIANFKIMNVPDGESTIEEAAIHGDVAVVRLATKSTVLLLANQQKIPMDAREFFVLNKRGDQYKISRYMYNKSS